MGDLFTTAGGKAWAYVAQAQLLSAAGGRFGDLTYSPASGFRVIFRVVIPGEPYRIQRVSSIPAVTWTDFTNFTYTGPTTIIDPSAGAGTNRFYRAVTPELLT